MTNKPNNIPTSVAGQPGRLPPVRVKMCRTGAFVEKVYPPDGDSKNWWQRLNKALGTASSDFVNASLLQIQAAARSPFGTISETAMNAALAMIAGARPKDEIEGALTVQMACTHTAAMALLGKLDSGFGPERRIATYASAASSFAQSVCDANGGSSTPAERRSAICLRPPRPCERRWAGRHRQCEAGELHLPIDRPWQRRSSWRRRRRWRRSRRVKTQLRADADDNEVDGERRLRRRIG